MIKEELKLFDRVEELIPAKLREEDVFKLFFELLKEHVEPISFRAERKFPDELRDVYGGEFSAPYQLVLNYLRGTKSAVDLAELLSESECYRRYFPSKSFLGASMTQEEREQFYSKYPKLVVRRYAERGRMWYKWGYFFSYKTEQGVNKSCSYMVNQKAWQRYGYRASVVKNGVEKKLVVWEEVSKSEEKVAEEVVEVREGTVKRGFFTRGYRVGYGRFLTDHGARKRIYPVKVYHKYYDRYEEVGARVLNFGYDGFMELNFKYVQERRRRLDNVRVVSGVQRRVSDSYAGECLAEGRHFFPDSTAYTRLYMQAYLYDENVAVQWGRGFVFLDSYQYFSMPVFNVELWFRVFEKVGRRVWWQYGLETRKEKLKRLMKVLRDLVAVVDRVWLFTRTRRRMIADGTVTAGMGYVVGEEISL